MNERCAKYQKEMASLGITDEDIAKYGQSLLPNLMAAQSTLMDGSSTEDGAGSDDMPLRPVPTKVLTAGVFACAHVHCMQTVQRSCLTYPPTSTIWAVVYAR